MGKVLGVPLTKCSMEDAMVLSWFLKYCKGTVPKFYVSELKSEFSLSNVKELEGIIKSFSEFDNE